MYAWSTPIRISKRNMNRPRANQKTPMEPTSAMVSPGSTVKVRSVVAPELRLIAMSATLDGAKVDDDTAVVAGTLPGGVSVLRRGKKTLAGVFVQDELTFANGRVSVYPALRWDYYKIDPENDPLFTSGPATGQDDSKVSPLTSKSRVSSGVS